MADKLAGWARDWLAGTEGEALGRAAAQALGLQALEERARFARRVPGLLPAILSALQQQQQHKLNGKLGQVRTRTDVCISSKSWPDDGHSICKRSRISGQQLIGMQYETLQGMLGYLLLPGWFIADCPILAGGSGDNRWSPTQLAKRVCCACAAGEDR